MPFTVCGGKNHSWKLGFSSDVQNVRQWFSGMVPLLFPIWCRHFYGACFHPKGDANMMYACSALIYPTEQDREREHKAHTSERVVYVCGLPLMNPYRLFYSYLPWVSAPPS